MKEHARVVNLNEYRDRQKWDKSKRSKQKRERPQASRRPLRMTRAGRFLIFLFLFACALGGYLFSLSAFFFVEDIVITGNSAVSAEKILALSGVQEGQNIFSVNANRAEQCICINPYIKSVELKKSYPDKIEIHVEERQAVAILPTGNTFIYIDRDGRVLDRQGMVSTLPLYLISGLSDLTSGLVPGSMVESDALEDAMVLIDQLPEGAADLIAEIDMSNLQQICFYTLNGTKVRLGDNTNIVVKYDRMTTILEELENSGKLDVVQYIDVSIPERAVINY